MEESKNVHMECSECGGNMVLDDEKVMLVCPYCGNREALDETTASRLNSQDAKNAEKEKVLLQREKHQNRQKTAKGVGKAVKIAIAAVIVLVVGSAVCTVVEDAMWEHERANRLNTPYEWPTTGPAALIPQPEQKMGDVVDASDGCFEIEVVCDSESSWLAYIEQVKKAGFTVYPRSSSSSYEAYNESGYSITVYYWKYLDKPTMEVRIEEPLKANQFMWPTKGVASLVPMPPSVVGKIHYDNGSSFHATLINISPETFASLADACLESGFDAEYNRQDDCFYGTDAKGNTVRLEYLGFSRMDVSVSEKGK